MMVIRKTAILALLLVAVLFAENASATFLPLSTFGAAEGWEGTTSYEENVSGGGTISGEYFHASRKHGHGGRVGERYGRIHFRCDHFVQPIVVEYGLRYFLYSHRLLS